MLIFKLSKTIRDS